MNNARCKGMLYALLFLTSIPYIQALDNGDGPATSAALREVQAELNEDLDRLKQAIPDDASGKRSVALADPEMQRALQELEQLAQMLPAGSDMNQVLHEYGQQALDVYFKVATDQLQAVDCILENLAINIATNRLVRTKNRAQARDKIVSLRMPLQYIKNTNFVPLDPQIIISVIHQINGIATELMNAINNGIDTLEAYDPSASPPPTINQFDPFQQIEEELQQNDALIMELEKKTARIGLRYYNIAWRWLKRNAFSPWQKYHLTEVSLGGLFLLTTAFTIWYYFGGDTIPWLREHVGWPAQTNDDFIINDPELQQNAFQYLADQLQSAREQGLTKNEIAEILKDSINRNLAEINKHGQLIAIQKPVGWLGRFEHTINKLTVGKYILGSLILFPAGLHLIDSILPSLSIWARRKAKAIDNFLTGGAYRYKEVDDMITESTVTLDDLIGCEDAKQYAMEVIRYLQNPEPLDRVGIAPKTGILLFGDTRTGKSYWISAFYGELVRALGSAAGFKLWKVSYQTLFEKGIQWVLDHARQYAPCVVVIEEIDLLGLQRTENRERLAAFMTAMNSCLQEDTLDRPVIVIGTTNRLQHLDGALKQAGRFGKHFYFQYPNLSERKQYIERELTRYACLLQQFNINNLGRFTEGCSYEKIGLMLKDALMGAKIYGRVLTQESLEASLEKIIYGISIAECTLDQEQLRIIATHLAGEILVTNLLADNISVAKATIRPVSANVEEQPVFYQYYGDTKQNPLEHGKIFYCHEHDAIAQLHTCHAKEAQCKIHLGGYMAEELMLGSCSDYHPKDKQQAYEMAQSVVAPGYDLKSLPKSKQQEFCDKAFKQVELYEQEVRTLLEEHRDELMAITDTLMQKQIIGDQDITPIMTGKRPVTPIQGKVEMPMPDWLGGMQQAAPVA